MTQLNCRVLSHMWIGH